VTADALQTILQTAFDRFREDSFSRSLLERNLSELSITHRLACHLENVLGDDSGLVADVEFNRDAPSLQNPHGERFIDHSKRTTVLVLHRPGPAGPNVLAVEAMKPRRYRKTHEQRAKELQLLCQDSYARLAFDHGCILIYVTGPDPRFEIALWMSKQ